jgi:hypothetical protein
MASPASNLAAVWDVDFTDVIERIVELGMRPPSISAATAAW